MVGQLNDFGDLGKRAAGENIGDLRCRLEAILCLHAAMGGQFKTVNGRCEERRLALVAFDERDLMLGGQNSNDESRQTGTGTDVDNPRWLFGKVWYHLSAVDNMPRFEIGQGGG